MKRGLVRQFAGQHRLVIADPPDRASLPKPPGGARVNPGFRQRTRLRGSVARRRPATGSSDPVKWYARLERYARL